MCVGCAFCSYDICMAAVGLLARGSSRSGAFTAQRPGLVLAVSLLLAGAICAGWARFRLEDGADVLCECRAVDLWFEQQYT
jgi:hypothetical protein